MSEIRKLAVVGAGVMGAGIAAQIANAGYPVRLLDIVPPGATERNAIAAGAIARMAKTEPAPLMSAHAAKLITPGNTEDDLESLADCDWIIEAVIEDLPIKQALYRRLAAVRKSTAAISSNTSTIPLAALVKDMPADFARHFMITHFFNPPRYMRLLELVGGSATDPALLETIAAFADRALGKSIVRCKDSPGFIANRLGVYWMQMGVLAALDLGLSVEEADAVMGRPVGIPKTGIFGLIDLVGLDLMPHINASLAATLPQSDPFHAANRDVPLIGRMIREGLTGRKGKGGFYRLNRAQGARVKEAIDLATGTYRPEISVTLPAVATRDLGALMSLPGKLGAYARRVLTHTLAYAAMLVPEAAEDITAIDEAMRLGYNWKQGPFELIDRLGLAATRAAIEQEGLSLPPLLAGAKGPFYRSQHGIQQYLGRDGVYHDIQRPAGVLLLADIKRHAKPLAKNSAAALWDIGDGVVCLEFTSKMNALDQGTVAMIEQSVARVREEFKALVIYNEGANFSVGANLGLALFAANMAAWSEIEKTLAAGQRAMLALKYAPFPVVAAPAGMALGGGCEILLHSDAIQAHAETYAGLVECGVGLVPGWGGTKEMLARWQGAAKAPQGPMPALAQVFEMISTARVAKSAAEAREMRILREGDGITMNRDRLLADAKARALALAVHYAPPTEPVFTLPGTSGKLALMLAAEGFYRQGLATQHDLRVAEALAGILSGGETDLLDTCEEANLLTLEREAFMRLIRTAPTLARIEHTLETGKPLRN